MILDNMLKSGRVLVLDGAVSSEIARRGGRLHDAVWSALAGETDPDIVRGVHESYIRAGADVVTANTFATCRHVLAAAGRGDDAAAITRRAVTLARDAIDRSASARPVAVAGSMSNTLAWLPGTFSPDARYVPRREQEAANYREMAEALAGAGVDLIITEMMLDVERASLVTRAAIDTGLPVWVGVSCSLRADHSVTAWDMHAEEPEDRLATEADRPPPLPFAKVVGALAALRPQVMGVMHSRIEAMEPGLAVLRQRWEGPVMAYPEATPEHHVEPALLARHARRWAELGVRIIGGCCGTGPQHTRAIAAAVEAV